LPARPIERALNQIGGTFQAPFHDPFGSVDIESGLATYLFLICGSRSETLVRQREPALLSVMKTGRDQGFWAVRDLDAVEDNLNSNAPKCITDAEMTGAIAHLDCWWSD
jgi:hypothetical protein